VSGRDLEKALGLWEQAGQHYARALALKPDMHEAESNSGVALYSQAQAVSKRDLEKALGLWEQAEQHYARALALKPDKHEAESNWGGALNSQAQAVSGRDLEKALGLWEQAGQHFARALALKPDKHEAESNWGIALNSQAQAVSKQDLERALGLWEQAGQHFARALALKPDMYEAEDNFFSFESARHHALLRAGRASEAQAVAKHALERFGAKTGKPSYNRACVLCINGRIDEALDLLESLHKSSDLRPDAVHLAADPDLASLAEHPRFLALLALLRASSPRAGK
jgi:pentatricopeptide repeat protein